jgi:hypothetical protein
MEVNVIITCHDTEEHLPVVVRIVQEFKLLQPRVMIVYSGKKDDVPCHLRIGTTKDISRELVMTVEAIKGFQKQNKIQRFLKISAHIWPADEQKIVDAFQALEDQKTPYGGNYWHHNLQGSLAADFFILDLNQGNFLRRVDKVMNDTEVSLYQYLIKENKTPYIFPDRHPIFWSNFYECEHMKLASARNFERNKVNYQRWTILGNSVANVQPATAEA